MSPHTKGPPNDAFACTDIDERVVDFLYDELDAGERRAFDAHVAGCARCQAVMAGFGRVREAARVLPLVEPPGAISLRLLEAAAAGPAGLGALPDPFGFKAAAPPPALRLASSQPASSQPSASAAPPHRRRFRGPGGLLRHPGFAAAASFLVVGASTAWFLSVNPSAVMRPEAASPVALAVPADPAVGSEPASAPEAQPAVLPAPAPVMVAPSRTEVPPAAKAVVAAKPATAAIPAAAPAHRRPSPSAGSVLDEEFDRLDGVAVTRGGAGAVAGRPTARAEAVPPPARPRDSEGKGQWLGAGQKEELERSVEHGKSTSVRPSTPPTSPEAPPPRPSPAPSMASAPRQQQMMNSMAAQAEDRRVADHRDTQRSLAFSDDQDRPAKAKREMPPAAQQGADTSMAQSPLAQTPPAAAMPSSTPAAGGFAGAAPPQRQLAGHLGEQLAQFRGALVLGDCQVAADRYQEIHDRDPGYRFARAERWDTARCMEKLHRFEEARVALTALRSDEPGLAVKIDRELDGLARAEQLQLARRHSAPSQTPSVHASPAPAKKARAAKAAADEAPAQAAPAY